MKPAAQRVAIVLVLLMCVWALAWIFKGRVAAAQATNRVALASGVFMILDRAWRAVRRWPRRHQGVGKEATVTAEQMESAGEYLAGETLGYWRGQAKDRRITTPSPVVLRWSLASQQVAVSANQLQFSPCTNGVVGELRGQLYERLRQPTRVVVLGEPGAGKTVAMLLLLIDILEHRPAGSGEPVPVWLTLGGWDPETTSLQDWTAANMLRNYPGLAAPNYGGPSAARELIRTGRVALFLDGLDEMAPALQGRALERIDRDAVGLQVVLTSRPNEYEAAVKAGRLWAAVVIDVLPVNLYHAGTFLLAEQLGDRRLAWQRVIHHMRAHPDSIAARTLTTPLALSLARETYVMADPAGLLDDRAHPTPEALLQHLLTRFLTLAYPTPGERDHATRWLSWIARHMGANTDLRWWDIPTWVPHQRRRAMAGLAASGLTCGLMGGLVGGLNVGLKGGLVGLICGFAVGLVVGRVSDPLSGIALNDEPRVLVVRKPSHRQLRFMLMLGLWGMMAAPLMSMFMLYWLVLHGSSPLDVLQVRPELIFVLMGGFIASLTVELEWLWNVPLATARAVSPIETYRSDRRQTLVAVLVRGLIGGLVSGLAFGHMYGLLSGLVFGPMYGLMGGLLVVLMSGLGPALQLIVLEVGWRLRGQRVRFLPLLETALKKQVLCQAGGVFQFRHAALQGLLASS